MNAESPVSPTDASRLEKAFEALLTYDRGSGRAALLPIDSAVQSCLGDPSARKDLENRLARALSTCHSVVAREYALAKLALIGSESSVPQIAEFLADPELSTPARNALEAMPRARAGQALRDSLRHLRGTLKAGVLNSLGNRRDAAGLRPLVAALRDPDAEVAAAAAAALGNLGTPRAGKALRAFYPQASEPVRLKTADAALTCAERLRSDGKPKDSLALYEMLAAADGPGWVKAAAIRGRDGR
jgi:HEAT repeat protein